MKWSTLALLSCLVLGLGSFSGCSKDDSGAVVEGMVTYDGQPLPSGHIDLIPVDGIGPSSGAEITAGKYRATAMPGSKRVNITAEKVTGQQKAYPNDPNSPVFDIKEQYIPARYNNNSELKCEAKSGSGPINFDLQSAAAKK